MTVNRKAGRASIGYIISVGPADLTTPESLKRLRHILAALPQMVE